MHIMRWFFRIFILIAFVLFCRVPYAYADTEFQADYDIEYAVAPSGVTVVTQRVTLTNLLTNVFAKQYSITLDTDKVKNIIAYDNKGVINPQISQENGKTSITVLFNERIVGLGKKLVFTLRFENTDIAVKNGSIWEVNVPGIASTPDLGDYSVSLQTPPSFGANAYMAPLPADGRKWNKKQMIAGGISAAYGQEQFFTVKLTYILENPEATKKLTELALPPDSAYQKVSIREIDPKPVNIVRDTDGNWLARYEVEPKSSLKVTVDVTISIRLTPRDDFGKESIVKEDYLKATKYWNSDDPAIKSIAQQFTTPREIYNYVVDTLTYDYGRVNENVVRKGALKALQMPGNSVCMEFTDVFIAIARAAGIPARQAIGYAYTTNTKLRPLSLVTDVMHAWPEYYDDKTQRFIPVDPTWANTTGGVNYFDKLDFNHIVFAFNGIRDDYPYPAGSYKETGKRGKFVDVQFADPSAAKHLLARLEKTIDFPGAVIAGLPSYGRLTVRNITGVGIDDIPLTISSEPNDTNVVKSIDHIPPFTSVSVPFIFGTKTIFQSSQGKITASVAGEIIDKNFIIRPLYVIIIALTIVSLGITVILWIRFKQMPKQQKKNH
jgi:transglutaminase-like putative cysteine protease